MAEPIWTLLATPGAVPGVHRDRVSAIADHIAAWVARGPASATSVPVGGAHFDLAPCNVGLDTSAELPVVTVIDWELPHAGHDLIQPTPPGADAELAPAGIDLWFFAAYWSFARLRVESIADEASVVAALVARPATEPATESARPGRGDRSDPVGDARRCVDETASRLGISSEDVTTLWGLLWWQRYRAALVRAGHGSAAMAPVTREMRAVLRFLEVTVDAVDRS